MGLVHWLMKKFARTVDRINPQLKMDRLNANLSESIPGLGEIMNLEIDKVKKALLLEFELSGEGRPIEVTASYSLTGMSIKFTQVKADRPWVQALCKKFVANKSFQIPEDTKWLVEALLE